MSIETETTFNPNNREIFDTLDHINLHPDYYQAPTTPLTPAPLPRRLDGKKVLVTTESLGPINGVTRATQNFLEYLVERGIKTAALAPEFGRIDRSPLRKKLPLIRLAGLLLVFNPDLLISRPFRMQ